MIDVSSTCWVAIRGAAAGDAAERDRFVTRYAPVIHAYLRARWGAVARAGDIEDAVQEVFLECFRSGGALERADEDAAAGGFRGFLYGVTRNVAARFDERRLRRREVALDTGLAEGSAVASDEDLAAAFDRAWARSVMREAFELQETAADSVAGARRRVELLRRRFEDGQPIREIARAWNEDPDRVHEEYARARREFARALRQVVAFHQPGAQFRIDQECRRLLEVLS